MMGKMRGQMAASTMRAISKTKPMVNAGAKPKTTMKAIPGSVPSKPKVRGTSQLDQLRQAAEMETKKVSKAAKPAKTAKPAMDYTDAMDRGIRKALKLPRR